MQRRKLNNIIKLSKEISTDPFDKFKNSLPKDLVGDNYRLEAAWKAYDSPRNFKEGVWAGLIQPIDENTYKLPSIGYNEETDSYEYLNKGEDNDIVNKDIRVWDNDVIPLVQELKQGGYVRIFDKEQDCWKYTKNSNISSTSDSLQQTNIETSPDVDSNDIEAFKQGGLMNLIPDGSLHARKNNMENAGKNYTNKGIPVMSIDGKEQVAEIEKNEIILNLSTTEKIENYYKKFSETESKSELDEIAIKCGKILAKSIIEDTDDKTGLIEDVSNKS